MEKLNLLEIEEGQPRIILPVKEAPVAGPGACRACSCRGFKPTGKGNDICADCGHYWQIYR